MKTFRSILLLAGVTGLALVPAAAADSRKNINPGDLAVRNYTEPMFPLSLRLEATTEGYAQVVMLLAADGHVTDSFVTDFSDEPFAREAVRAVSQWIFESRAPRRVCVRFDFRREGVVTMTTAADAVNRRLSFMIQYPDEVRSYVLSELDRTPEPIAISKPSFPSALTGRGKSGFASVSFYIDESGAVHVPSVAQADQPEFGEAAVAAVSNWKFQPPQKSGRPVRVFVVQDFAFGVPRRTP